MPTHQRDSFIDIAVEEFDAENLAGGNHKMSTEHSTSDAEYRTETRIHDPDCGHCSDLSTLNQALTPAGDIPRSLCVQIW